MSTSQVADITQLFQTAYEEGNLSSESLQVLSVEDLGPKIHAAMGVPADLVQESEVVLMTIMPDDSGSIRFASNAQAVRDGHNLVLDALAKSKQSAGVLAHTRYLNGYVLFPYRPLEQAERMNKRNYDPNQGTPLYDQTVTLLATVLAKSQEFSDNNVPVRTVTLIITDGQDEHSMTHRARDVASIVRDMRATERHIVAAMGIADGSTDFRKVFREMGIEDQWILTPANDPKEIRAAFQLVSQSAVRASQGAASFSQTAKQGLGGFGP
jgi:hypothetical protein